MAPAHSKLKLREARKRPHARTVARIKARRAERLFRLTVKLGGQYAEA